jgi:hypothetical protein
MSKPTVFNVYNYSSTVVSIATSTITPINIIPSTTSPFPCSPYPVKGDTLSLDSTKGAAYLDLGAIANDYDVLRIIDVANNSYSDKPNGTLPLGDVTVLGDTNGNKCLNVSISYPISFISWTGKDTGTLKQVSGKKYFVNDSSSGSSFSGGIIVVAVAMFILLIIVGAVLMVAFVIYKKKQKAKLAGTV